MTAQFVGVAVTLGIAPENVEVASTKPTTRPLALSGGTPCAPQGVSAMGEAGLPRG